MKYLKKHRFLKNTKGFRPYDRIYFPEYNNTIGYLRNDHANAKILLTSKSRKNWNKFPFISKKENFFLFKTSAEKFPVKNIPDSFNRLNRFLFTSLRINKYSGRSAVTDEKKLAAYSFWRSKIFKRDITLPLYSYAVFLKKQSFLWKSFMLSQSPDGPRIDRLIKLGRISKNSFFFFKKRFFWKQNIRYKLHSAIQSSVRSNFTEFAKRIRKDYGFFYKPLRRRERRNFIISGSTKIWRRLLYKAFSAYLGMRTKGEINKLARLSNRTNKDHNSAGSPLKIDSKYERLLSNLVFKLKMAPSTFLSIKLIKSGWVSVDGKIVHDPDFIVPFYSTVSFKGNMFYSFLFTWFFGEDVGYDKFAARRYSKSSVRYLSRYRTPSYLEVSFKLQEAVILKTSYFYEQPSPFLFTRTHISNFFKNHLLKRGVGVF